MGMFMYKETMSNEIKMQLLGRVIVSMNFLNSHESFTEYNFFPLILAKISAKYLERL